MALSEGDLNNPTSFISFVLPLVPHNCNIAFRSHVLECSLLKSLSFLWLSLPCCASFGRVYLNFSEIIWHMEAHMEASVD